MQTLFLFLTSRAIRAPSGHAGRARPPALKNRPKGYGLIQCTQANEDIHNSVQGAYRAEDKGDYIKGEKSKQTPIESTDDHQDKSGGVEGFHLIILSIGNCKGV
jgi:hypothetical protein